MGEEQCVTDIVIVYTADAALLYPNMALLGRLFYERTNAAFKRSNVKQRTRLRGVVQWQGEAFPNLDAHLEENFLKEKLAENSFFVSQLKYTFDADLVIAITSGANHSLYIGYSGNVPATNFVNGSAVVGVTNISTKYSSTHETGHLFGARHHDDFSHLPAQAHEFDVTYGGSNHHYYTLMYSGADIRILNFSNPDVQYLGVPTGTLDRNNACIIQQKGCSVAAILLSQECRIRVSAVRGCESVALAASLKKDDGTVCTEAVKWGFDYSYDGITYITGTLTTSPTAVIPFLRACPTTVFLRIKAYNSALVSIANTFEWFDPTCPCKPDPTAIAYRDLAHQEAISSNILIYPNPGENEMYLDFSNFQQEVVEIQVTDLQGRLIFADKNLAASDQKKMTIDVKPWRSGLYFIAVKGTKSIFTQKFAKP